MARYKYLFDLDGTVTLEETLPRIASYFNLVDKIATLTNATIRGDVPFIESFIRRVGILGKLPVDEVDSVVGQTALNENLVKFIHNHKDQCAVVTGNFRGWVQTIMQRIGCQLHCSEGNYDSRGHVKLSQILKKEEVVRQYQAEGYKVVYIGDGNNDAEAMRQADVSIACGIIHWPAASVLNLCNFAIFDECALIRLLNHIHQKQNGTSLVISCAGIGSRLALDQTKALVKLGGKTIIERQLIGFAHLDDIRIVVGYQAKDLIKHVISIRRDVVFVFNHDYFHTKTGTSVYLGSRFSREYVLAWDGDLIVHPDDLNACLASHCEYLCVSEEKTDDGVNVRVNEKNEVIAFTREDGDFEWSGPACIHRDHLSYVSGHLYSMFEPLLPMKSKIIRAFDIDTNDDYKRAKTLYDRWFMGNKKTHQYYENMSKVIKSAIETRNKAKDSSQLDIAFIRKYADACKTLLDLGSGSGLILNHITDLFEQIVAVEKYPALSRFINPCEKIKLRTEDLLQFDTDEKFDMVTCFAVMQLFGTEEAIDLYKKMFKFTAPAGTLIVKHQLGVADDVLIDGYSEELQTDYYAEYRWVEKEKQLLQEAGFPDVEIVDIYPSEYNRWSNTHFYALVCRKV